MAIATLNPLFTELNGRIGNAVFYKSRSKQCVRTYVVPRNPDTFAQRITRKAFAVAVKSWQALTADEKYVFTRKARNTCMSGYNLFISQYMTEKIPAMHKHLQSVPYRVYLYGTSKRIHSVSNSIINSTYIRYSILYTCRYRRDFLLVSYHL